MTAAAHAPTPTPEEAKKGAFKRKRRPSEAALLHNTGALVNLSVATVLRWTEREAHDFLVQARFGGWDTVVCPHCGTISSHYFNQRMFRWKCAGCGSQFSVTSQSVLHQMKMDIRDMLGALLLWLNGASGMPALQNARNFDTDYATMYGLQQKVRWGLIYSNNIGLLSGDLEMDGLHTGGRRASEKRGRPQVTAPMMDGEAQEVLDAASLTATGKANKRKAKRGALDPEFQQKLPVDRRLLITLIKRSHRKGRGCITARVGIAMAETAPVVTRMVYDQVVPAESALNTDGSPAYVRLGETFKAHRTVDHSKELIGPNEENNNQAESFNFRAARAEDGVYLGEELKYLLEYAVEQAFREETRRTKNGDKLSLLLHLTMSVGQATDHVGRSHGKHRDHELQVGAKPKAISKGTQKGRNLHCNRDGPTPR